MFDFRSRNLVTILQKRKSSAPAIIFLEDGQNEQTRISHAELDQKARIIAAYLQSKKAYGERILLLYPAGVEFVAAFLGCLYAGAIAVPLSCPRPSQFEKSGELLNAIAKDADIAGILTTASLGEEVSRVFTYLHDTHEFFVAGTTHLDDYVASLYKLPKISGETIAYLQYTSGSTSEPKAAVIRHKNLMHSLKSITEVWHFTADSVSVNWAPHSHVYGIIIGVLTPLYHGTPAVLMPTEAFIKRPLSWLEAISKYKGTHSGCPNFGYELCLQEINESALEKLDLRSWVIAANGGENVRHETLMNFVRKFSGCGFLLNQFNSAYGMSEVTGPIAVNTYLKEPVFFDLSTEDLKQYKVVAATEDQAYKTLVSSGRLLPGLTAAIVDTRTKLPVTGAGIGEIWLAGDSIVSEYWNRSEEINNVFGVRLPKVKDKYFKTGDLGFIQNGELCITGRHKELLIVNGKKHYPLDLESTVAKAIKAYPVSRYCVATSLSVDGSDKIIFIQEVNEEFAIEDSQEVIDLIYHVIAEQHGIDLHAVIFTKANVIPKTPSGKIQRSACQAQYQENKLPILFQHIKQQPAASVMKPETQTHSSALETLFKTDFTQILTSILKIEIHNLQYTASELGLNSINVLQITDALNERFKLSLTPDVLFEFKTLQEFLKSLLEKHAVAISKHYQTSSQPQKVIAENKIAAIPHDPNNMIAVIGISGILPGAANISIFWDNLVAGKNAISEIPKDRWDWKDYTNQFSKEAKMKSLQWGGFIDGIGEFDADFFNISPREAEMMDPQQRLFLQTAWQVIEDAGYVPDGIAAQAKIGVFVGVFSSNYAEILQKNNINDAYITTGATQSMLANRISYLLNFNGPSETIDTACSSSLVAIHHAVRAIQHGDCEIAIAGGVNALLTPSAYLSAIQAGMLSEDGKCFSFDKKANGYVRAEGVAALLLKSLAQAEADGDHIYGVIKGSAVNHGGHVSSLTVPNPNAQAEVIIEACRRANISADSISYIETHGTGTPLGDPIEINGLKKAFTGIEKKAYCGLGALKTHIGHLESAAGIAGVIKALLAMQHKTLPGNLNFNELNPYIELDDSPFYILNKTQAWEKIQDASGNEFPRRAGISSFGFGGTNAHVILEEYDAKNIVDNNTHPQLILLSAKTEYSLQQQMRDLHDWLLKHSEGVSLSALCFTLNNGRKNFNKRCALVVESLTELRETLSQLIKNVTPDNTVLNLAGVDSLRTRPAIQALLQQVLDEIYQANSLEPAIYRQKLLAVAEFYAEGYELDWEQFHVGERQRISLPTYAFEKNYYWVPTAPNKPEAKVVERQTPAPINSEVIPQANSEEVSPDILSAIQKDFVTNVADLLKFDVRKINLSNSLSEQGFDSIAFSMLALQIEEYYLIKFNPSLFFTYNTILDLSQYLLDTFPAEMARVYQQKQPQTKPTASPAPQPRVTDSEVQSQSAFEPIAIIGMQGQLPMSANLQQFWQHLEAGDNLISEVPGERWDWREYFGDSKQDPTKTNSKWGGFIADVDKFDAGFFNLSAREVNLMDPQHRIFLETVWRTIEDAGYDPTALSGQDAGVFVGVEFKEYEDLITAAYAETHGYIATGNAHSMLPNRISYLLNFHGPSESIDTACSSALVAINRAVNAIQRGECSIAIAGAVNLLLSPHTYVVASQLGVLSPDGACKTFDTSANGYVRGEGVAAVLLKPLRQAQQDGDFIYGIIRGSAVNHGGKAQSITAPNVKAQSQLLVKAYSQANIDPQTISYIETHGTGTALGDPAEIEGLKLAFSSLLKNSGPTQAYCGLGSVKTNVGHLEPASGMAGMLKVLLALQHKKIPASLHVKELNGHIDLANSPFYIVDKTRNWEAATSAAGKLIPRRAGVSSFGFGGTNAHIILEEYDASAIPQQQLNSHYLLTLSAKQAASLKLKISDLHSWLKEHPLTSLADLSYTLNIGRTHYDVRCALVVSSIDELLLTLEKLTENRNSENCITTSSQPESSLHKYRDELLKLASLYVQKQSVDLQLLHANESKNRIAGLPTYPFLKQRHWYDLAFTNEHATQAKVTSSPAISPNLETLAIQHVQSIFARVLRLPPEQILTDVTYEIYGIDSILGLEIMAQLEKDFGTLPKTLLFEKTKIRDLAIYLQAHSQKQLRNLSSGPVPLAKTNSVKVTNDVAIIGLSGIYPMAKDINELWDNLQQGKNCVGEIPLERWDYKDYPITINNEKKYFKHGGFINDVDKFDPLFFNISPHDAAFIDPQERLFLQTAWSTIEDAGYTRERLQQTARNEVGVFVGVTHHFYPLIAAEEWYRDNRLPINTQIFSVANRVSYFLNLNGPSFAIDTACSASLSAIHQAYESIQRGECQMAIAGGVNLSLHPSKYFMLGTYNFLSEKGTCASFAADGAGYVPSEGVGAVLLKPLAAALRDNDHIYGIIKSSSMNHCGKTSGYTVPNPNAQADLISNTIKKANIDPRSITYVEAHGTGTSLGDPIEVRGLQVAFENHTQDKQFCAIGSVKSNIGHLESAAGISQLTKVLLQLQHKKLAPSLHAEKLNPLIDFAQTPFVVQRSLGDWKAFADQPRRAGISSFGAGGTNVHLIVEEFTATPSQSIAEPKECLLVLSAMNKERLTEYAEKIYEFISENASQFASTQALSQLCYTLQIGREAMTSRLAIIISSFDDLLIKLKTYIANPEISTQEILVNYQTGSPTTLPAELNVLLVESRLKELANLWVNACNIPWQQLYAMNPVSCIALPTYPFAKRRCWIPLSNTQIKPAANIAEDWLYQTQWELSTQHAVENTRNTSDKWLIFSDHELGFVLQDELGKEQCIYCFAADEFAEVDSNVFYINPERREDYQQLFARISATHRGNLKGVLWLWPNAEAKQSTASSYQLLFTLQALIQHKWSQKILFSVITRASQTVNDKQQIQIYQSCLWSMLRIFALEQGGYEVLLLDLDGTKELRKEAKIISQEIHQLRNEENNIAYRDDRRYVLRLLATPAKPQVSWTAPKAAIITGGLGGLGMEISSSLVKQGSRYLLLIGASTLADRSEWPNISDSSTKDKINHILSLEAAGATVIYSAVNVADKTHMQNAITRAELSWGLEITGVFHLAGITTDSIPIEALDKETLTKVLSVKVEGAVALDEIFNTSNIKDFVLFSSIAALPFFGMRGLSAYAMANEFLNSVAARRQARGLPAMSINWAAWTDKGMGHRYNHTQFLDAVGMTAIDPALGVSLFNHLMAMPQAQISVMKINWEKFFRVNPGSRKLGFFSHLVETNTASVQANVTLNSAGISEHTLQVFRVLLGLEENEIDLHTDFQHYGVDSIIGINFVSRLAEQFGDVISPMDLYRYPTLHKLINYIVESCGKTNDEVKPDTEDDKLLAEIENLSEAEISRLIEDEIAELSL